MRIGFDAKRAYHNFTGLGNYSRTLIHSLAHSYPDHRYVLFNPKASDSITFSQKNIQEIQPSGFLSALFPSLWRSRWMLNDITQHCEIYHGLSHELPYGANQLKVKKVVTMHDVIFETYPEQYNKTDVLIYRKKFKYAAEAADKIVAISQVTKQDLIHYYHLPASKIEVVYQACDQRFYTRITPHQQHQMHDRYQLPETYWLYVGSIIERKNLLRVIDAYAASHTVWPLVVIGKGEEYKQKVFQRIREKRLQDRIIFLEDHFPSAQIYKDLPGLYQQAFALLYPSLKEGFGLPVIEAMASGCPVITSQQSAMAETGEGNTYWVDPLNTESITHAMHTLEKQSDMRQRLMQQGLQAALQFEPQKCARHMMNLYLAL